MKRMHLQAESCFLWASSAHVYMCINFCFTVSQKGRSLLHVWWKHLLSDIPIDYWSSLMTLQHVPGPLREENTQPMHYKRWWCWLKSINRQTFYSRWAAQLFHLSQGDICCASYPRSTLVAREKSAGTVKAWKPDLHIGRPAGAQFGLCGKRDWNSRDQQQSKRTTTSSS